MFRLSDYRILYLYLHRPLRNEKLHVPNGGKKLYSFVNLVEVYQDEM